MQIGRYIVNRELGRGAMGVVFEARDPLIGRIVAVKTIRLDALGSPSEADWLQERLFREARSAGVLSHPGIVVIHDVGLHENLAFIAMERVDGLTLEQIIATGARFSAAEALDILRQTAAALDYAHQNGVVHRDIKPANLMLHKGVTLKITDFGIAKITSTQQLTRTGMVIGTPSYMSPEQITAQSVDGRADQFSLAVIAFELLAGRRPFRADTLAALVHQIVYEERPSARASRPDLSDAAEAVLNRGLSRDLGDRYPSCAAFVDALEKCLVQKEGSALRSAPVAAPQSTPREPEPARAAVVGTRCSVCGTLLEEGQRECGVCASFAGTEGRFKQAFGIIDREMAIHERPVEAIPEPREPVPFAASAAPWLSAPPPAPSKFSAPPQPPAPFAAPEPPWSPPAAPSLVPAQSQPLPPAARATGRVGWRTWMAVAAAIATITYAAIMSWVVVHRQLAPAEVATRPGAPLPASEPPAAPIPAAPGKPSAPRSPAPVVNNFSADRPSIERGQTVRLMWSVANATDVRITPGVGKVGSEGDQVVAPSQPTGYTLVAKGPGGEVSQRVVVQVTLPVPAPPAAAPRRTVTVTGAELPKEVSAADIQKASAAGDYARVRAFAEQGNALAQNELGNMYQSGKGVPKDDAQAVAWLRKSADQGNAAGQYNLGYMYANGRGVPKDDAQAAAWYRKSADQGTAEAQGWLGMMYANGTGVPRDGAQAVVWLRKSADQGNALGQGFLGLMYHSGIGVPKDDAQAVAWFRKSADQGNALAQGFLGLMYANGLGVLKDDAQAVAWFRKSADQDFAMAQHNLGFMYEYGVGLPKDQTQAINWYRKAADQGWQDAKDALVRLAVAQR